MSRGLAGVRRHEISSGDLALRGSLDIGHRSPGRPAVTVHPAMDSRDGPPQLHRQSREGKPLDLLEGCEVHAKNFAHRETSHKGKFRAPDIPSGADAQASWPMASTLHRYLKAHRKLRRFTQEHVANILHISHNAYSDKENGKRPVTLEELEKLAEAYGVHPSALLLAPAEGPRADLMRRAAEIARTRPEHAAQDWVRSGEHLPPDEKTSQ